MTKARHSQSPRVHVCSSLRACCSFPVLFRVSQAASPALSQKHLVLIPAPVGQCINGRISYQTGASPATAPSTPADPPASALFPPPRFSGHSSINHLSIFLFLFLFLFTGTFYCSYYFIPSSLILLTRLTTPFFFLIPSDSSTSDCSSFCSAPLQSTTFVRFLALQSPRSARFRFRINDITHSTPRRQTFASYDPYMELI